MDCERYQLQLRGRASKGRHALLQRAERQQLAGEDLQRIEISAIPHRLQFVTDYVDNAIRNVVCETPNRLP